MLVVDLALVFFIFPVRYIITCGVANPHRGYVPTVETQQQFGAVSKWRVILRATLRGEASLSAPKFFRAKLMHD